MPKFTGYYTQYGRPIYTDDSGAAYSERTATIQAPNGYWYNVPTVLRGGSILPRQSVEHFYRQKGFSDPVTGARLTPFRSVGEAESVARSRSAGIKWIARGGR